MDPFESFVLPLDGREVDTFQKFCNFLDSNSDQFQGNIKIIPMLVENDKVSNINAEFLRKEIRIERSIDNLKILKMHKDFYFFRYDDIENDIIYIVSDARKDKKFDKLILKNLKKIRGLSLLYMGPKELQDLKESIIEKFPDTVIPYFTGIHDPNWDQQSFHRKNYRRTIQYTGLDGAYSLDEIKYYYGILPRIIEFNLPNGIFFRIDLEGIFTFFKKRIRNGEEIISHIVEKIKPIHKKIKSEASYNFNEYKIGKRILRLPIEKPWRIELNRPFNFTRAEEILDIAQCEEWDFSSFGIIDDPDEKYFKSRFVDGLKGDRFEAIFERKNILIYPLNNDYDMASALRFYSFVSEAIDYEAEV